MEQKIEKTKRKEKRKRKKQKNHSHNVLDKIPVNERRSPI